jgi:nucleoside phosphorylase
MLLITPSQVEYSAVETSLRDNLAARSLEVVVSGMGPDCAAALCRKLEARASPPVVLTLVGFAGGLHPSLAAGDAVLGSEALFEDGRRAPCTIIRLPGATVGPVLTVSKALYTPPEKAAARVSGALAVEMEAYPLAVWAAERGLPFVHARVILDPVDEVLPDLGDLLDDYGRVRPAGLVRRLLLHPTHAAAMVRLMRRSQAVTPTLGRLARQVVEAYDTHPQQQP